MENQPNEIISTENQPSEMTPKVFLSEVSNMFTTIDRETEHVSKPLKQKAEKIKKKFYKRIQPYLLTILMAFNYSPHLDNPAYENIELAQMQMQRNGITDDQRKTYIPGVSELLQQAIIPFGRGISLEKIKNFASTAVKGKTIESYKGTEAEMWQIQKKEDAWRIYLGLPQKNNTFDISNYHPSTSKEDKYYYKINNFIEGYLRKYGYIYSDGENYKDRTAYLKPIKWLLEDADFREQYPNATLYDTSMNLMGNYKISRGQDENGFYVSYYDKWDLDEETGGKIVGKPFEIYDRIYYDLQTLEIIDNSHIPQGNVNKTK